MALLENKKTKMLLVAAVGAFALSAGAVANLAPVSAEVTPTNIESFVMQDGAGVRTDDKKAIRFTTAIDKEDLNALIDQNGDKEIAVVTMITPTNILGEALTSENFLAGADFDQVETVKFSGERLTAVQGKWNSEQKVYDTIVNGDENAEYDKYVFRACLYNIQVENLTYNFSARSYITVDGEVYDYTDYSEEKNSRNIWDVADKAIGGYEKENTEAPGEPYDYLAELCAKYDVKVTNGYTGEEETFTVKRGDKISYENAMSYNALTANVDGQAYLSGLTKADGSAYADEIVTSDLTLKANYRSLAFTLNDDGETYSVAKGTLSADDTDTVIIPDTYKDKNVTAFASEHKFNGSQFEVVKVSNNITSIPGEAFFGCKNLKTVIMPSVTKTENVNVFFGCTNLKTVVVNGEAKFSRKTFTTGTVEGYTPQVDLYIDGTENNITYWKYDGEETPKSYDSQSDMLTSNVYYYAENMGEKICCGTWHYAGDVSVEKSDSATHSFADGGCKYCEAIDAEGVAYGWDSEKQCYYVANNASLNKAVVEILNEYNDGIHGTNPVSYVADKAFCLNENNGNKNIVTVILPENVKSVGASAFASCTNLETMIMSEVTQTTGTNVFYKCTALTTVVVNANATFNRKTFHTDGIADYTAKINLCVDGAENNITFGDNNGMIANTYLYSADGDCGTWKWNSTHDDVSITVHNERKDGYCANCFAKLDATKAVTYAWDATKGTYYVSADDNVTAPAVTVCDTFDDGVDGHGEKAVTYVANNAFQSNTKIVTVILPESVTSVGAEAFFGCTNLTTVVMAGVTKTEGTNVFYNCTSLTKVVVNGEAQFSRKTFYVGEIADYVAQVNLYIVGTENNITYWNYGATPPVEYVSGNNMLSGVEYFTGDWTYDTNGLPVASEAQA